MAHSGETQAEAGHLGAPIVAESPVRGQDSGFSTGLLSFWCTNSAKSLAMLNLCMHSGDVGPGGLELGVSFCFKRRSYSIHLAS